MKVFILAVILSLCVLGTAQAAIETHAGAYYSFKDHGLNHTETFDVVKIKDLVSIESGYAGDLNESDHKFVAALSVDIKQLKLGNYVKLPVLDLLEFRPALFAGLGCINGQNLSGAKFDWGLGASFISYKF